MLSTSSPGVGTLLRAWRQRRRLSQLELAAETDISTRHLSFVETGRSQPSRRLILQLAESLNVPYREQNELLLAAGYAPVFSESTLADPALQAAHEAVESILRGHEPYPALAFDRHWNALTMNRAVPPLLEGVAPFLLAAPVNILRLSLHPQGLAPNILNLAVWREHLLTRLKRQLERTADRALGGLFDELLSYPVPGKREQTPPPSPVAVPLQLGTAQGVLSLLSTTTVFGTTTDVTLAELALETFFPVDEATAAWLRAAQNRALAG